MNTADTEKAVLGEVRFADIDAEKAYSSAERLTKEIEKVIIGKHREVTLLVTAMLAGAHVLIEDVPGTGKTTLASSLAAAAGLSFRRAQFTPDLTASDITGFNIYNRRDEKFQFTPGVVMTNILLADEINRASPKTQSALLEAMEEGKVTVDGESYELPSPFMVIATQNPSGFVGTHPLPEAQLDRFGLKLSLGYPTAEEEARIVSESLGGPRSAERGPKKPAISPALVGFLRALMLDVHMDEEICRYIVALVQATRNHPAVSLGASPRASIAIKNICRAYAFMQKRSYVVPEDVCDLFTPAVAHRLILSPEAKMRRISAEDVTAEIVRSVPIPRKGRR